MANPKIAISFSSFFEGALPACGVAASACNTENVRTAIFSVSIALLVSSCTSRDAGREAYKATQETKKAAKAAGRELKHAAKEAHQGWNEAKGDDKSRHRE